MLSQDTEQLDVGCRQGGKFYFLEHVAHPAGHMAAPTAERPLRLGTLAGSPGRMYPQSGVRAGETAYINRSYSRYIEY